MFAVNVLKKDNRGHKNDYLFMVQTPEKLTHANKKKK